MTRRSILATIAAAFAPKPKVPTRKITIGKWDMLGYIRKRGPVSMNTLHDFSLPASQRARREYDKTEVVKPTTWFVTKSGAHYSTDGRKWDPSESTRCFNPKPSWATDLKSPFEK